MPEEFRIFVRTGLYVAAAGGAYWLVSSEPSGTVLLAALLLAVVAFVGAATALAPRSRVGADHPSGLLDRLNRLFGFHEPVDEVPPLEGEPDVVPLGSAWPILTAAATALVGLGVVFGTWLLVPGIVLLAAGVVGWITQLDQPT